MMPLAYLDMQDFGLTFKDGILDPLSYSHRPARRNRRLRSLRPMIESFTLPMILLDEAKCTAFTASFPSRRSLSQW